MQRIERAINVLPLVLLLIALITGGVVGAMLESKELTGFREVRTAAEAAALRASLLWMVSYVLTIVTIFWNTFLATAIAAARFGTMGRLITGIGAILAMLSGGARQYLSAIRKGSALVVVNHATQLPIEITSLVSTALWSGAVALILAAVIALGRRAPGVLSAAELRLRIGEARLLLFSTAALLAATLILPYLTIVWPLKLPPVDDVSPPVALLEPLAVTVALASGIFYTAMLIIFFVPIAIIHEHWIEESWNAAQAQTAGLSRAKWLSENGLDRSLPATAAQILAIAAPWLAAVGLPKLR